jgi:hypothetical protein
VAIVVVVVVFLSLGVSLLEVKFSRFSESLRLRFGPFEIRAIGRTSSGDPAGR